MLVPSSAFIKSAKNLQKTMLFGQCRSVLAAMLHDWVKFGGGLDCRLGPSPHVCVYFGGRKLRVGIAPPTGSTHRLPASLAGAPELIFESRALGPELFFESRALGPELGP